MDCIFIEGLQAEALVGIYPRERVAPQVVEIDLSFALPATPARRDDIADTIDYDAVVKRIRESLCAEQFNLLETMAEFIANLLLDEFGAPWVRVSIAKPRVLDNVGRVGVFIERTKDGEDARRPTVSCIPAAGR